MSQPLTTHSQILVALARGKFEKADGRDRQAFLGAEGDIWLWENARELVVVDHHKMTIRVEIHDCEGPDYWFVNLMTGEIEGN